MESLPWLGLGLSSNLSIKDVPQPWRLLDESPGLFDFVEYSAPLALDEARSQASLFEEMWRRRSEVPVLFHPVHLNLYGPTLEPSERLRAVDEHARAVGSPWVGNDIGWWHTGGEPFPGYLYVSPPLDRTGVDDACAHADHVQAHLSVPLLLENPAVIGVRGNLHVLDFMAEIHRRTGCGLILDLGHLFSHQLARGLQLTAGFDGFPFDQVRELHLAGGVVTRTGDRRFYVDDHTQPVREELFELLEAVLPKCPNLCAVTFEGDGHPPEIAALTLRRLRRLVRPKDAGGTQMPDPSDSLKAEGINGAPPLTTPRGVASAFASTSAPERAFREAWGIDRGAEDPTAFAVEVDFRLAVLAQTLDRAFPLTRMLLAPSREDLLTFVRSDGFRGVYERAERSVEKAFSMWAIPQVRARGEPALEAVLALESLAASGARPPPGRFPVDLREAHFAVRALRRHLLDRAWVSGEVATSALDALWQVVRRNAALHPRASVR